ncbi:MAG: trypsin-like peptidase domain-containing protein [bacterium]
MENRFCSRKLKPYFIVLGALFCLIVGWSIFDREEIGRRGHEYGESSGRGYNERYTTPAAPHLVAGTTATPTPFSQPPQNPSAQANPRQNVALTLQQTFNQIAANVEPAVVNIKVVRHAQTQSPQEAGFPANVERLKFSSPFNRFVHEQSPGQGVQPTVQGVGSGVIVHPEGYILTNNHLVEGAETISITLSGSPGVKHRAQVVKTDIETDLALLQVGSPEPLPVAELGDSSLIQAGDWVLAIGSPFGLEHSVTSGIISDVNRTIQIDGRTYTGLIQTDAAINQGNSGGPLVNLNGEVVGVNVAVYSPDQTFTGISLAVPINQAADVLSGIVVATHHVTWQQQATAQQAGMFLPAAQNQPLPWFGLKVEDFDPKTPSQMKLPYRRGGVLVAGVEAGALAEQLGVQPGDVITRLNGRRVMNSQHMWKLAEDLDLEQPGTIEVVRGKKRMRLKMNLAQNTLGKAAAFGFVQGQTQQAQNFSAPPAANPQIAPGAQQAPATAPAEREGTWLGMETVPAPQGTGVLVDDVSPGSKAERAGLLIGDVIISINGVPVRNWQGYLTATNNEALTSAGLGVLRNGQTYSVVVD